MRSIFSRYASKFNHKYHRRGHLFGGPYRQAVCLDKTYLLTASVYIHLNPVRAGLTQTANAYQWSSSLLYCQDNARESFVDPNPILRLLDEDNKTAQAEYSKILQGAQGAQPDNALEQEGAIEKFCKRLTELFPALFRNIAKKQNQIEDGRNILELTQLQLLLQELPSGKPRSPESKKARQYLIQQLLARGFKKTEIAAHLNISRKTVYNILNSLSD